MDRQTIERADATAKARAVADSIRAVWPAQAGEIDAAIAEFEGGKRDGLSVTTSVRFKLEKFDGEIEPGKQPYEVIEGEG